MDQDDKDSIRLVSKMTDWKKREYLAKDTRSMNPKSFDEIDNNVYLFNCKNGTYNLKTFEL